MAGRSRLVAVVFLVVQLSQLVPSCSAKNISSTSSSYDGVNHHKGLRDKEYHLANNFLETSSDEMQESNRHETTTLEKNKLMTQVRSVSAKDEHSTKSSFMSENNKVKQQQSSTTYISIHRQTRDVEDIFNEIEHKDPQEYDAIDWIVLILFLTMFCWIYSCLCALCCCGRRGGGGGSTILNWLCCWEICCRGGQDVEVCCDYAAATIV